MAGTSTLRFLVECKYLATDAGYSIACISTVVRLMLIILQAVRTLGQSSLLLGF